MDIKIHEEKAKTGTLQFSSLNHNLLWKSLEVEDVLVPNPKGSDNISAPFPVSVNPDFLRFSKTIASVPLGKFEYLDVLLRVSFTSGIFCPENKIWNEKKCENQQYLCDPSYKMFQRFVVKLFAYHFDWEVLTSATLVIWALAMSVSSINQFF